MSPWSTSGHQSIARTLDQRYVCSLPLAASLIDLIRVAACATTISPMSRRSRLRGPSSPTRLGYHDSHSTSERSLALADRSQAQPMLLLGNERIFRNSTTLRCLALSSLMDSILSLLHPGFPLSLCPLPHRQNAFHALSFFGTG